MRARNRLAILDRRPESPGSRWPEGDRTRLHGQNPVSPATFAWVLPRQSTGSMVFANPSTMAVQVRGGGMVEVDPGIESQVQRLLADLCNRVREIPHDYPPDASWRDVSRRVKQECLPRHSQLPRGYELCVLARPCDWVGNDLCDTIALDDGHLVLVAGTITSAGPAIHVLLAIFGTIRRLTSLVHRPEVILKLLNPALKHVLEEGWYIPLFIGCLDPETNRLDYVNAGFERPALVRSIGDSIRLEASGPPLGFPGDLSARQESVIVDPGTLLCIWCPGIPEACRANREPVCFFGEENLLRIITDARGASLQVIGEQVFAAVDSFLEGVPADDEMMLLLLRRRSL